MLRVLVSLLIAAVIGFPAVDRIAYAGVPYLDPGAFGQQVEAQAADGELTISRTVTKMVYEIQTRAETRTKVVEVDGEQREVEFTVEVPVTVCKPVSETVWQTMPLDRVQAFDMQGKRVEGDQLAEGLKEERTVLMASRKVPRYYLTIYKLNTLLLVVSPQGMYAPPASIAPPPPAAGAPRLEAPRTLPAPVVPAPAKAAAPLPPPAPVTPAAPGAVVPLAAASGMEPQVSMARIVDEKLGLRRYVKDISTETAMREVEEGGVKKLAPFSIETESIYDVERKYPRDVVRIYRADQKPLTDDELAQLKVTERCVLVSSDGKDVDPKYLKILKAEALIVVTPFSPHQLPVAPSVAVPATLPVPVPMPPTP